MSRVERPYVLGSPYRHRRNAAILRDGVVPMPLSLKWQRGTPAGRGPARTRRRSRARASSRWRKASRGPGARPCQFLRGLTAVAGCATSLSTRSRRWPGWRLSRARFDLDDPQSTRAEVRYLSDRHALEGGGGSTHNQPRDGRKGPGITAHWKKRRKGCGNVASRPPAHRRPSG